MEHALKLIKPKLIFVSTPAIDIVTETVKEFKIPCDVVALDQEASTVFSIAYKTFLSDYGKSEDQIIPEEVDTKDKVAIIVFSSGTTGKD